MNQKPSSGAGDQDPSVVEGEIIGEATVDSAAATKSRATANPSKSSRAPWYLAGALAVFIGGLFAGPWAEATLRQLFPGLLPSEASVSDQVTQLTARLEALEPVAEALASASMDLAQSNRALADLAARMTDVEQRTGLLEESALDPAATTDAVSSADVNPEVLAQIAQIISRIDRLENAPAVPAESGELIVVPQDTVADEARVNQLEMRLALLEEALFVMQGQDLTQSDSATLLPIAFVALARDLETAIPYDRRLRDIRAVLLDKPAALRAAMDPHLAALERSSQTGIAKLDDLQAQFGPIISEILKSGAIAAETTWWGRAWADVKGLVVVRPVGDVEGADIAAVLARAESALGRGDVASALDRLSGFAGDQTASLSAWIVQARAYADAQSALDHAMAVLLDRPRDN